MSSMLSGQYPQFRATKPSSSFRLLNLSKDFCNLEAVEQKWIENDSDTMRYISNNRFVLFNCYQLLIIIIILVTSPYQSPKMKLLSLSSYRAVLDAVDS